MRQLRTAITVVAIGVAVAGCSDGKEESGPASPASTTTSSTRAPVAEAALDNLLLTPAEIDAAMGVTGMSTKEKIDKLPDVSTKNFPQGWKWPAECTYAYGPAEATVYGGSGNTALRGRDDTAVGAVPGSTNELDPELSQVVILFPSADKAAAFFTAATKAWPACSDRQFTTPGDPQNPEVNWKVGVPTNADSTLSTPISVSMAQGAVSIVGTCRRVLTARNNVVIDLSACGGKDVGDVGVKIANQIAGKVDKL